MSSQGTSSSIKTLYILAVISLWHESTSNLDKCPRDRHSKTVSLKAEHQSDIKKYLQRARCWMFSCRGLTRFSVTSWNVFQKSHVWHVRKGHHHHHHRHLPQLFHADCHKFQPQLSRVNYKDINKCLICTQCNNDWSTKSEKNSKMDFFKSVKYMLNFGIASCCIYNNMNWQNAHFGWLISGPYLYVGTQASHWMMNLMVKTKTKTFSLVL